jgi:hypothetical protein
MHKDRDYDTAGKVISLAGQVRKGKGFSCLPTWVLPSVVLAQVTSRLSWMTPGQQWGTRTSDPVRRRRGPEEAGLQKGSKSPESSWAGIYSTHWQSHN